MEIIVMMNDNWAVKDNNIVRPVTRSTVFLFKSAADMTVARRVVADKREAGRISANGSDEGDGKSGNVDDKDDCGGKEQKWRFTGDRQTGHGGHSVHRVAK
jgi:hypothetical protein